MQERNDSVLIIFCKIFLQIIIAPFTFSVYPTLINVAAFILVFLTSFATIRKGDYFSFFIQLFICNHFTFGNDIGGVFNLTSGLAFLFHHLVTLNGKFEDSTLNRTTKISIICLGIVQILSLLNNENALVFKFISAIAFLNILLLFFYSSKMIVTPYDFYRFVLITTIFFSFMFMVSLNQKYNFIQSNYPVFPSLNPNSEYELDIKRSTGTLLNYEAYAEYSISIIAICLPGILSGSFMKFNKLFHYVCCTTLFIAIWSIVLSGTRSSIFLLPLVILLTLFLLKKRTKVKNVLVGLSLVGTFLMLNLTLNFVDFTVFSKRSENIDIESTSLSKILNGEDMNRGDIFAFAINKIEHEAGLIGKGYYTNKNEYTKVHFDKVDNSGIPDFHNLYFSAIIIWGYLGTIALLAIFFSIILDGFSSYKNLANHNLFLNDLLIGFIILFCCFMINEFKIQFIRDANYFVMVLILLSSFNSLNIFIKQNEMGYFK